MKQRLCWSPLPVCFWRCRSLSSRVSAWHPWIGELSLDATHAVESLQSRWAIKSNLRNPRSGAAHPRQKEMGQLPSRTEKQKRNVLLARLHGTAEEDESPTQLAEYQTSLSSRIHHCQPGDPPLTSVTSASADILFAGLASAGYLSPPVISPPSHGFLSLLSKRAW